jgi:hypothetical protein
MKNTFKMNEKYQGQTFMVFLAVQSPPTFSRDCAPHDGPCFTFFFLPCNQPSLFSLLFNPTQSYQQKETLLGEWLIVWGQGH